MKLKKVVYGYNSFFDKYVFRIFCEKYREYERQIDTHELPKLMFLCKIEDKIFLSKIRIFPGGAVIVVRTDRSKLRIEELDELYLIES